MGNLERHHLNEVSSGGDRSLDYQQLVRRTEHLAEHLRRAYDPNLSKEERLREIDTVMGRIGELTEQERIEFNQMVELLVGVKVRFV
jgi:hypothetical protein